MISYHHCPSITCFQEVVVLSLMTSRMISHASYTQNTCELFSSCSGFTVFQLCCGPAELSPHAMLQSWRGRHACAPGAVVEQRMKWSLLFTISVKFRSFLWGLIRINGLELKYTVSPMSWTDTSTTKYFQKSKVKDR